tara:strand:+ start:258 stop:713 length:456 start_codon:yes stop_codon:yes gene_type:complete
MLKVKATLRNQQVIADSLIKAFALWASEDINESHWDDQFKNMSLWDYDNETRRKNGEVVSSPRDIYDLGKLYQSGVDSFALQSGGGLITAKWHWDAKNASGREYAGYVHDGTGTNRTARPFTDDISIASSFFLKAPGMAFRLRIKEAVESL